MGGGDPRCRLQGPQREWRKLGWQGSEAPARKIEGAGGSGARKQFTVKDSEMSMNGQVSLKQRGERRAESIVGLDVSMRAAAGVLCWDLSLGQRVYWAGTAQLCCGALLAEVTGKELEQVGGTGFSPLRSHKMGSLPLPWLSARTSTQDMPEDPGSAGRLPEFKPQLYHL